MIERAGPKVHSPPVPGSFAPSPSRQEPPACCASAYRRCDSAQLRRDPQRLHSRVDIANGRWANLPVHLGGTKPSNRKRVHHPIGDAGVVAVRHVRLLQRPFRLGCLRHIVDRRPGSVRFHPRSRRGRKAEDCRSAPFARPGAGARPVSPGTASLEGHRITLAVNGVGPRTAPHDTLSQKT
jgi:hypothetical protein